MWTNCISQVWADMRMNAVTGVSPMHSQYIRAFAMCVYVCENLRCVPSGAGTRGGS